MDSAIHALLSGGVVGAGAGVLLFFIEYLLMLGAAKSRVKRAGQPVKLNDIEKRRLGAVGRFCLLLPFAFAAGFWVIWS
jgi:hypothetical protein